MRFFDDLNAFLVISSQVSFAAHALERGVESEDLPEAWVFGLEVRFALVFFGLETNGFEMFFVFEMCFFGFWF